MKRTLSVLLLAASAGAPLPAQTPGTQREIPRIDPAASLSTEIPAVADSLRVAVPGTRVRLAPPPAFTPAERFSGFQDAGAGASIVVMEIPGPFAEVRAAFTPRGLQSQGMDLRSLAPLRVGGHAAVLILARQSVAGVSREKQILAFGHDSGTVLITGNYPASAAARMREPVRRAVLSAAWSGGGPVDLSGDLPFEVTETPELKRAGRLSNSLMFTESGTVPVQTPGEATVVVAVSFRPADLRDLPAFSRNRLRQVPSLRDIAVRSGGQVEIGGASAYELVADARSEQHGIPLVLYQAVISDGSAYTILYAEVAADRADRFLPQFRAMARSIRAPRPAPAP